MTQDRRPVEEPTLLIRRAITAYATGRPDFEYSVGSENQAAWSVLQDPDILDSETSVKMRDDQLARSRSFSAMHRLARPEFSELAMALGSDSPRHAGRLIKIYRANDSFLKEAVEEIYQPISGRRLAEGEAVLILSAVPEFSGYLLGWAHSIFSRSLASSGFGSANAGDRDLLFATYLGRLGLFVTADEEQYRALRLIGRYFAPACKVMRYREVRRQLLSTDPPAEV
jgi:hypothetical protein